ncbi:MAG: hypothetical protein V7636_392, partial [Actinomycetota bacterium]
MCLSTSTRDPTISRGRELGVVVAIDDAQLRAQCVDAARHNPHLRLLEGSDIAGTFRHEHRPDVVVVAGTERSELGISAIAVARDLYPAALVLPVTEDDVPRRILDLAALVASDAADGNPGTGLDVDAVRMAIEAGQPSLAFQPVVDLQDRRLIGVEALARFRVEPQHPPDLWFEAAHRVGLGVELERRALATAVAAASVLPPEIYMAVNVSPETVVAPGLDEIIGDAPREQLVLEITEHARVDDYVALRQALASVRDDGVRIAIDDVGAGFASLRHVLRLDPEIIKLDHEITRGVEHNAGRAKLVGGLIAGASAVSTLVIAEGIETETQLRCLLELGVRGGQGYF